MPKRQTMVVVIEYSTLRELNSHFAKIDLAGFPKHNKLDVSFPNEHFKFRGAGTQDPEPEKESQLVASPNYPINGTYPERVKFLLALYGPLSAAQLAAEIVKRDVREAEKAACRESSTTDLLQTIVLRLFRAGQLQRHKPGREYLYY